MVVLGYLPKLKRYFDPAFGSYFLYDFSITLYNTLSMDKVSMSYLFSSQDIKQYVLLSSCLET